MKREELLKSKEYWLIQIQNRVFNLIENFRLEKKLKKTEIAQHLGVTKGYVSQILNGDYDHKVSKLVDLALAFDKAPVLTFVDINQYIKDDREDKVSIGYPIHQTAECFVISSDSVLKLNPKISEAFMSSWDNNLFHSAVSTSGYAPTNTVSYSQYKPVQALENGK